MLFTLKGDVHQSYSPLEYTKSLHGISDSTFDRM